MFIEHLVALKSQTCRCLGLYCANFVGKRFVQKFYLDMNIIPFSASPSPQRGVFLRKGCIVSVARSCMTGLRKHRTKRAVKKGQGDASPDTAARAAPLQTPKRRLFEECAPGGSVNNFFKSERFGSFYEGSALFWCLTREKKAG